MFRPYVYKLFSRASAERDPALPSAAQLAAERTATVASAVGSRLFTPGQAKTWPILEQCEWHFILCMRAHQPEISRLCALPALENTNTELRGMGGTQYRVVLT